MLFADLDRVNCESIVPQISRKSKKKKYAEELRHLHFINLLQIPEPVLSSCT
jgi:hypothetical protein